MDSDSSASIQSFNAKETKQQHDDHNFTISPRAAAATVSATNCYSHVDSRSLRILLPRRTDWIVILDGWRAGTGTVTESLFPDVSATGFVQLTSTCTPPCRTVHSAATLVLRIDFASVPFSSFFTRIALQCTVVK